MKREMAKKRVASEAHDTAPDVDLLPNKRNKNLKFSKSKVVAPGENPDLLVPPRPDWHASSLPEIPDIENAIVPSRKVLEELHEHATGLLSADNSNYRSSDMSQSSKKFLSTIMTSGTLEDKVSALTLSVQESPLHTMKAFEHLLSLARKRNRNQALMVLAALKDLLAQGMLLPPERKLRAFIKQPALIFAFQNKASEWRLGDNLPGQINDSHLVIWAYEDWLKKRYFEIIQLLESWCNDEVEYARGRAMTYVWELLKEKPEQEENLLRLLVNKLGDTSRKIASRASYLILQLQVSHPLMKEVIINAIESELLFRPGQSAHAKYYAIITLNQTILSVNFEGVANKLLDIYFAAFMGLLKISDSNAKTKDTSEHVQRGGSKPGKKQNVKAKLREKQCKVEGELDEKIMAQLLTGVNRAWPFSKTDDATFESNLDKIFLVAHSSNFNTTIQALLLLQQISASKHYCTDRFYRTLYDSLLDPRLLTSSKQIMYLNLLYRSLKSDINIKRVKAFVKRLLQIINLHGPPFVCGVLYLVAELEGTFPSIKNMLDRAEIEGEEYHDNAPDVIEKNDVETGIAQYEKVAKTQKQLYDGRKRDPEHSNADRSCLWELLPFQTHFHPSVSLFASRLLHAGEMPPKPNPTLHTLMHFLDRFVYRNAKSNPTAMRGSSIMQPMAGTTSSHLLIRFRDDGKGEAPLNTEAFWQKKIQDVPVDEVFFHDYFIKAGKRNVAKAARRKSGNEDIENEENEDEIWKALVGSRPDIEGSDNEDDTDGLDSLFADSDSEAESEADSEANCKANSKAEMVEYNSDGDY